MTLQRQVGFWCLVLGAFILFVWIFRPILLPFAAGLALAYVLDPLADRLQRLKLSRLIATILILAVFLCLFIATLIIALPVIFAQISAFIDKLPATVARLQQLATTENRVFIERLFGGQLPDIHNSASELISQGAKYLGAFLQSLWSGGQAILSLFSLLVVTPVVAFYLLLDFDHMTKKIDLWIPPANRPTVRRLAKEINQAIAGFVRGQATVCLLLGLYYAIGLVAIGLNFGALIGALAGLISFIPYVGSLTGLVLAMGVAIAQFWPDWIWIAAVLAVFASGQFIEGNILSPNLVGKSVGLHPVWLMFALFAFGYLFGFVGLILAVPLAAAIGVLARFALERYLKSQLYKKRSQE